MTAARANLRVALDMTLGVIGMTGVERYATVLHERLLRWPGIDVQSFAAGRGATADHIGIRRRYRVPVRVVHALWRSVRQPRAEWLAGGADVVHGLGGMPPPTRRPLVLTVHDLLPLTHPEFFSERTRAEAKVLARNLERAAVVVTTCDSSATEVERLTAFPSEQIVVAPLGPRRVATCSEIASRRPAAPYFLAVGAVTPRKDLATLADAVALLGPSCPPVLVAGPDGFLAGEVRSEVDSRDVHRKFRFLGAVDDGRLDDLMAGATIVCHPSRAEGFGMVCLEAMAHGVPVVATDLPSVQEIGGGVLELVPVGDASAMAATITHLLADEDRRRTVGAAARERASSYSWDRFTGSVVEAYERAVDASI